jgi:hypothetical protein
MIAVIAGVAVAVGIGIVFVIIATMRKRRPSPELAIASTSPGHSASWTASEGDDFATLTEAARCELIFALQDLPGDERTATLRAALDDPSEIVALAAATALAARGQRGFVEGYFAEHPGARSQRIGNDLTLLRG